MTSENFYYILPELALSMSLDEDNDALMIVKKYCDERDYIHAELTECQELILSTDEVTTAIYCGLDPIMVVTCVGMVTAGRYWWMTEKFKEVFGRMIDLWGQRPRKKAKKKVGMKRQLELF